MPAQQFSCDLNTLLTESVGFLQPAMGESEIEGIDLYLRVANLAASGGANYVGDVTALTQAAAAWQRLSQVERKAIALFIDLQDAVDDGAVVSQTPNTLKIASTCYACLPKDVRKNTLLFLKCALSQLGKPE